MESFRSVIQQSELFVQIGGDLEQSKAGEKEACGYDFSNRSVAFQSL